MSLLSGLRASRDFLRARITKHYSVLTRSQSENRTIFALSTPPGKGGIAVIRISGPEAHSVWRRMVKSNIKTEFPPSRVIHRCLIVDRSKDGAEEVLDDGLAVFFKGALPAAYRLGPSNTNLRVPSCRSSKILYS